MKNLINNSGTNEITQEVCAYDYMKNKNKPDK